MDGVIRRVYFDPANPGSYGGKNRLKEAVLEETGHAVTNKEIDNFLEGEETYTLHKPARIHFKRNRVIVYKSDSQWQIDLVDMSQFKKENKGITFLLTCIDLFSKYAWVRVLKNKTAQTVTKAFEHILKEGRTPVKLQSDRGSEFFNSHFKKLIKRYNIHHFATGSNLKSSVVERFNRTLKTRMWRFLTAKNTKRYYDILADLVDSYNHSKHRSIKMRPVDVTKDNENMVFKNLYGSVDDSPNRSNDKIKMKYKVGDIVRISKLRGVFDKGYQQNFTHEYFTVVDCLPRRPPVYILKDYDNEIIEGAFYEEELQKIRMTKDNVFKVEKILARKNVGQRRMVLVRFLGWPPKFDRWLPAKDVFDI